MKTFKRKDSLGWLLNVASNEMAIALDTSLKEYDLDIKLWPTLFALSEKQGQTQTELAKSCRTQSYTTTRVLDRLEEKKLIARKACENSRRAFRIHLTAQGEELVGTLLGVAKKNNRKFLSKLPKEEQKSLISLLQSLVE